MVLEEFRICYFMVYINWMLFVNGNLVYFKDDNIDYVF